MPVDKSQAVEAAVAQQLQHDHHPTNEPDKVMGDNYHYTYDTMEFFLLGVEQRLRKDDLHFDYGQKFITDALKWSVELLTAKIYLKTHGDDDELPAAATRGGGASSRRRNI